MESSDGNTDVPCKANSESDRIYECKYCDKSFKSRQAFGGHQNAHKNERPVKKRSAGGGLGSSCSSFSHSDPVFSFYNRRPHEFMFRPYPPQPLHRQQGSSSSSSILADYGRRPAVGNLSWRFKLCQQNGHFGGAPWYCHLQDQSGGGSSNHWHSTTFPANARPPQRDGNGEDDDHDEDDDDGDDDSGLDLTLKL